MKATITWVKVEERLPEPGIVVLVCTEADKVTTGSIVPGSGLWSVFGGGDVKWWADWPLPPSKLKPEPRDYRMIGWVD